MKKFKKLCLTIMISNISILFQNLLRNQNNKNNYNLVSETLMFLDCICGSTTGGLGLLGLYINESNVALINQTLETLTEYCQGKLLGSPRLTWLTDLTDTFDKKK